MKGLTGRSSVDGCGKFMNFLFSTSFLLALFSVHMYCASKHAYEDIHFKLTMNYSSPALPANAVISPNSSLECSQDPR